MLLCANRSSDTARQETALLTAMKRNVLHTGFARTQERKGSSSDHAQGLDARRWVHACGVYSAEEELARQVYGLSRGYGSTY